eukprot:5519097-Prymnesium_polylepis.1
MGRVNEGWLWATGGVRGRAHHVLTGRAHHVLTGRAHRVRCARAVCVRSPGARLGRRLRPRWRRGSSSCSTRSCRGGRGRWVPAARGEGGGGADAVARRVRARAGSTRDEGPVPHGGRGT